VNYPPEEMEITQKDGFCGYKLGQNLDEIPNFNALIFHPLCRKKILLSKELFTPWSR
jgi:hypothetical protein